ncbi:uncharacterized protein V1518DRAFT_420648 [Limtongia smithiae]|uniref:uncharacterized protein n=1 Tax=Limtongia smithiae TaxID=1125753 RepID=UPI0034CF31EF
MASLSFSELLGKNSEAEFHHAQDLAKQWHTKLVGKKITDSVSDPTKEFARGELPADTRVGKSGSAMTLDWKPKRVNVTVDDHGVVQNVTTG